MKKNFRKTMAVVCSLIMTVSLVNVPSLSLMAEEEETGTDETVLFESSTEISTEGTEDLILEEEDVGVEEPQVQEEETGIKETSLPETAEEDSGSEEVNEESATEEEQPEESATEEEQPEESESEEETEKETEETGDPTADVETAEIWEATLPQDLTGTWGDDIVKIAQSQLGYTESTRNFVLVDGGTPEADPTTSTGVSDSFGSVKKGYSRYGAWYGSPYEDWCAMFASFCLYYAGVPQYIMPESSRTLAWVQELKECGLYADVETSDYQPVSGDLIFFSMSDENHKNVDHVGIIESTYKEYDEYGNTYVAGIYTIEGNSGNAVRENYYDASDVRILGYGILPGQTGIDEETSDTWEASLPVLTGDDPAADAVAIAQSQIGYTESRRNFTLSWDFSKNGYTRYGAWYGDPYGDWNTMFVSFCLAYSDNSLPVAGTAAGLLEGAKEDGIYENAADYVPAAGDVVFFTSDGDTADRTGIIERVDTEISDDGEETATALVVIEGDFSNAVCELTYGISDNILGYAKLAGEAWDGYFDINHPERGGIAIAEIAGDLGGTVTAEIPEGAFSEMVTLKAEAAVYAPEEADPEMLDAVLTAADKTDKDNIYDLYVINIYFINGDGEEIEPSKAVSIAVDISRNPVDLSADKADAEAIEKTIYHISKETGEANAIGDIVSMNDENQLTGMAFASEAFSPFVLLLSGEENEESLTTLTYEGEDYVVTVTFGSDAGIPENADLIVSEYDEDSDVYQARLEEAEELYGWDSDGDPEEYEDETESFEGGYREITRTEINYDIRLFNIGLYVDGKEVEPAVPVDVTITFFNKTEEENGEESDYLVTHFGENTEMLDIETESDSGEKDLNFAVDAFSDFMVTAVSEEDKVVASGGVIRTLNELPTLDSEGHDSFGNFWTYLGSSVDPVSSANLLDTKNPIIEGGSSLLSIDSTSVSNRTMVLIDLSSDWSNFESQAAGSGYTLNNVGSIRFHDAGTVKGEDVDILITLNSIKFYGSFKEGYLDRYSSSTVNTSGNKICIAFLNSSNKLWVGLNYNDGTDVSQRYNNTFTYPCVEDVDMTIRIVKSGTSDVVDANFLQVASDIDIERNDTYRGHWAETFSTLAGFNGNFYVYETDQDLITINGFGQVTVSAEGRGDTANDSGNNSYTLGGIYADTSGGSWQVMYTDGYCSTEVEIYDYTENDVTIVKVDADDEEKTLQGAEFLLYYTEDGQTHYYQYDSNSEKTSWTTNEEEATKLITGEDGKAVAYSLSPGTYYLQETKAPDGYNQLDTIIEFAISTYGYITTSSSNNIVTAENSDGVLILTVKNASGAELPNTGGIGTLPFITFGLLLSGTALGFLFIKLRRRRRWVES